MKTRYDQAVFALHSVDTICKHFVRMRARASAADPLNINSPAYVTQFVMPQLVPKRVF